MKTLQLVVCALVLAAVAGVQAATLHVPSDYPTIQAGINAAVNGDTVLVASGTYYENINFNAKAIVVKSQDGPDVTIIDANGSGTVVTFNSGEDNTSVLEGFTIQNASDFSYYGAGIQCGSSSPKIINNIIQNNSCRGGGIACHHDCAPLIFNNIIRNNHASEWGGAILGDFGGCPIIKNNLIYGNSAGNHGQGLRFWSCVGPQVINNTLVYHTQTGRSWTGGVIESDSGSYVIIKNNIIAFNREGLKCTWGGTADISYNDVWGNTDGDYADCSPGVGDISEDPLFVDAANGDYHLQPGSPCIDAGDPSSPLDPDGTRADMGAFPFDQTSTAVELSIFTAQPGDGEVTLHWVTESEVGHVGFHVYRALAESGTYERITTKLIAGGSTRIGRREYAFTDPNLSNGITYWYKLEDVAFDGTTEMHGPIVVTPQTEGEVLTPVEAAEVQALPAEFRLSQNVPNPFNPVTTITYDLPEASDATLTIHSITGQHVATLVSGPQEAGRYWVVWDGLDDRGRAVATGIYLYRLEVEGFVSVKKMALLR